jgi:hypothetical protein
MGSMEDKIKEISLKVGKDKKVENQIKKNRKSNIQIIFSAFQRDQRKKGKEPIKRQLTWLRAER